MRACRVRCVPQLPHLVFLRLVACGSSAQLAARTLRSNCRQLSHEGCVVRAVDDRDIIERERNRELRYYSLTPAGRKHLRAEEARWKELFAAVGRVMWPAEETN